MPLDRPQFSIKGDVMSKFSTLRKIPLHETRCGKECCSYAFYRKIQCFGAASFSFGFRWEKSDTAIG
jgi:hypothetical protein